MTKPLRLQLSRAKGFNLQAMSRGYNGLDAVNIARPSKWGNPFIVSDRVPVGKKYGDCFAVPTVEDAISTFRVYVHESEGMVDKIKRELRGKNLACWCKHGSPCHGDVLIEIANGTRHDSRCAPRRSLPPRLNSHHRRGSDRAIQWSFAMKFVAEKSALVSVMAKMSHVVERRNTIPVLANVLITTHGSSATFRATDLDTQMEETIKAEVGANGSATVPANMLNDIVRKMPDGAQIRVSQEDESGQVKVQSGRSNFKLSALSPADFPNLAMGEMLCAFSMPAKAVERLFGRVQFAISTEETRYYLNGVYFHNPKDTEKVLCVATDGHRLAKVSMDAPQGATGMPGVIVPKKTVAEVLKLVAKRDDEVSIRLSSTKIEFTIGETKLLSKLIDGEFPDYDRVIPANNNRVMIADREGLADAIDRVSVVSSERGRATKLSIKDNKLEITVINPEAGSAVEEVEVDYGAEPIDIGFNGRYMIDILAELTEERVRIHLADAGSPTLIKGETDDLIFVLMPMRV